MLFQIIASIVAIIALIFTFYQFREGKMSVAMLVVWSIIWIGIIIVALYPNAASTLAIITGIGRGLDLIIIVGLIGAYYLIFKIFNTMENIEEEITNLTREIALSNENRDETEVQTFKEE